MKITYKILFVFLFFIILYFIFSINVYGVVNSFWQMDENRELFTSGYIGHDVVTVTVEQEDESGLMRHTLSGNYYKDYDYSTKFDFKDIKLNPKKKYTIYITYDFPIGTDEQIENINIERFGKKKGKEGGVFFHVGETAWTTIDKSLTGIQEFPTSWTGTTRPLSFPCVVIDAEYCGIDYEQEEFNFFVEWNLDDSYSYDLKIKVLLYYDESSVTYSYIDVIQNPDAYKTNGIDDATADKVEKKISKVLSIISGIGMIVTVVMLAVYGVKYILGSIDENVDFKRDLVPYFIGAVLLFGIIAFVNVFLKIGDKISSVV